MKSNKLYVIDTNVLIYDPQSIFSFSDSTIIIPMIVLEELDQFKTDNSERGRNVRSIIRTLDMLRANGNLRDGVELSNGCHLSIALFPDDQCKSILSPDIPDNVILNMALCLKEKKYNVELISKDINMRVKADIIGINATDYIKDDISSEHFYKGWIRLRVPAMQLKKGIPQDLIDLEKEYNFSVHEYIIVESQNNPYNHKLFCYEGDHTFRPVHIPELHWGIHPKNVQQQMAFDLLLNDTIEIVTLLGPAGTGKTFLTLVAALHKLLIHKKYTKILVSRPVIPLGADIGYLPGTLDDKLHNWMQPIYDNMEFIVYLANEAEKNIHSHDNNFYEKQRKDGKRKLFHKSFHSLEELISKGLISMEAITYMRGRSIPHQFIFIDEVQNLTPHEVKTIVSRAGEGSKIILAGDPYQIDSPYLDFLSNGLMITSQRFRGEPLFGTVFLETSERSELSKLAGKLL